MSFVIPSKFDESTVPLPNDSSVALRRIPPRLVAVLPFSGVVTDEAVYQRVQTVKELLLDIPEYEVKTRTSVEVAQVLPFLHAPNKMTDSCALLRRK